MSTSTPSSSFATRLTALAGQLSPGGRESRQLRERASRVSLPFQPLSTPQDSIWWQLGPHLERLVDLPRGALSGPVQEDKAAAHAVLVRLVQVRHTQVESLDLRQIDGLSCAPDDSPHAHLEDYAATPACRSLRVISYKDFLRVIGLALPGFARSEPLSLRRADWCGERLFWSGEQHGQAFASAVAYARMRGLQTSLPAEIAEYRLSADGLAQMQAQFHMLAMPAQAWSDPAFMGLLLDTGLPYSRLALKRTSSAPEALLLPRSDALANAMGEGLRLAGAPDLTQFLCSLPRAAQ